jgi:hypothetical protein
MLDKAHTYFSKHYTNLFENQVTLGRILETTFTVIYYLNCIRTNGNCLWFWKIFWMCLNWGVNFTTSEFLVFSNPLKKKGILLKRQTSVQNKFKESSKVTFPRIRQANKHYNCTKQMQIRVKQRENKMSYPKSNFFQDSLHTTFSWSRLNKYPRKACLTHSFKSLILLSITQTLTFFVFLSVYMFDLM